MDVSHDGHRAFRADAPETLESRLVGNRHAHDVATGVGECPDLRERRVRIVRVGAGHGLHDNRRSPADLDRTDVYGTREVSRKLVGHRVLLLKQAQDVPAQDVDEDEAEQDDAGKRQGGLHAHGHLTARDRLDDLDDELAAVQRWDG